MNTQDRTQMNNSRWKDNLIKVVLLAVLAAFLFFVYDRADAGDVDVSVIGDQLLESTDIDTMEEMGERDLLQFIGIDAGEYESFLYYKSGEALGVEEVLILKAKDKEDLSPARDAVQARIEDQIRAFESYGPEQVQMLRDSVLILQGRYLFYCTAPDTEPYEEVFRNAV